MSAQPDEPLLDLRPLVDAVRGLQPVQEVTKRLQEPGCSAHLVGVEQRILSLLTSSIASELPRPLWVVTPGRESANRLAVELEGLVDHVFLFPPCDGFPRSLLAQPEILSARFEAIERLCQPEASGLAEVLVIPLEGLLQPTLPKQEFEAKRRRIRKGDEMDPLSLSRMLLSIGYEPVDRVETPGSFSRRGGIVDIYPPGVSRPFRIEFFGDEVASLRCFSPMDQLSVDKRESMELVPASEKTDQANRGRLFDYLLSPTLIVWSEPLAIEERLKDLSLASVHAREEGRLRIHWDWEGVGFEKLMRGSGGAASHLFCSSLGQIPDLPDAGPGVHLSAQSLETLHGDVRDLGARIQEWVGQGYQVSIVCNNEGERDRMREILAGDQALVRFHIGNLEAGFCLSEPKIVVLTDQELFHRYEKRYLRKSKSLMSVPIVDPHQLEPGDWVVHAQYGIGRYRGLDKVDGLHSDKEFLCIEYADKEKLYLPTDQLHLVDKYVGPEDRRPSLHALGGRRWEITKRRVSVGVLALARELLDIHAARQTLPGYSFPKDNEWQQEFERAFPYEETPDQADAIREVKEDMESTRPTDRLVCGDVGYGKTEVAVRAAFKACMAGRQTAILVPTTVLAQQHLKTFRERMADYPIRIEMLSRFLSKKEQAAVLREVTLGQVDIVIGTHRLIQKDVVFKDLGLVIIDEEQRFGVVHKEKLKKLRTLVDVLTLTATPIPRTLHMALMGIRDMSVIDTPPEKRLPISTWVEPFDLKLVREAILREMSREGQVYLVHNRVQTIDRVADAVREAVPEARIAVGHGQLPEKILERVMWEFSEHRYDCLVCTTIIESGLDIPNVNTILIDRADRFGLAQLHQLRGRVGRYVHRAYAYLLIPKKIPLSRDAKKRLAAIAQYDQLGSGFQIAMRDLEIRGAGNILGSEQHGLMVAVGFHMYLKLLNKAVAELKGEKRWSPEETLVDVETSGYLPPTYVLGEKSRLEVYRRLASADTEESLKDVILTLKDRFGPLPQPAEALMNIARIRIQAGQKGLSSVARERDGFVLVWPDGLIPPKAVASLEEAFPDRVTLARKDEMFALAVAARDELTQESELDILQRVILSVPEDGEK